MREEVYIIAGGVSLKNMNFASLKDKDTIVVNKSVLYIPNPTYFLSMDYTYVRKIKTNTIYLQNKDVCKVFIANTTKNYIQTINGAITDVRCGLIYNLDDTHITIKSPIERGLSNTFNGFANGDNSGFCALQFALLMGYKKIYLGGVDLRAENGTHFHGGYGESAEAFNKKLKRYYENFVAGLCLAKTLFPDTKVYSISPISRLNTIIPFFDIKQMKIVSESPAPVVNKKPKSNKVVFISYYTKGTPYEAVINECLLPTLQQFNLAYDIEEVKDLGSWFLNTGYKSKHILNMLLKHKTDVVFVDADARIMKTPEILFKVPDDYDLCAHHLDWNLQWRGKSSDRKELLSGTMLFKYNPKVISLLREFIVEVENHPNAFEQKTMQNVIEKRGDINIYPLPKEYIVVPRQDNSIPPHINKNEIVILHTQASRKYRDRSKWGLK